MKQSASKAQAQAQATYKAAKTQVKKATIALRTKRKGGKRTVWEVLA